MTSVNSSKWEIEGRVACAKHYSRVNCPYDEGSEPYNRWMKGYDEEEQRRGTPDKQHD